MSMKEQTLAKVTFYTAIFVIVASYIISNEALDFANSKESGLFLHWGTRLFFSAGILSSMIHLVLMWRHMYRSEQWRKA